ncbi:MAG: ammonium transporter [Deltaproteobacteria bacterium]|nr:ammonium transporter [Deltaproteobacteria bacterium]
MNYSHRRQTGIFGLTGAALFWARPALAEEAATAINTGDTAWVLTASALVLMMTLPGLALFYGGLVRAKNILNVLMQCFLSAGIVGVLWVLVGYSLAFGTGGAFIGDLSKVGLAGVTLDSVSANFATPPRNIPEYVFVMFQAMFAIITPALILGAIAERMKFSVWVAFISLWLLVVYCPIAHMVWASEGWIFKASAIDFAGGLVVHMSSGMSAIVAALILGKRQGFGKDPMPPHNLPLCLIGAGLLWAGWFGFNSGSALSASPLAALAFLNTSTAASMAVVAWALIEWVHRGKPTALGGATAAVAGLVAITPACGNVSPLGAIAIGAGVAVVSYAACTFLKPALGYDDSLDVFGVHGLGGMWGALASGLFAVTLGSGVESNAQQFMIQLKSVAFVTVFSIVATTILLMLLKAVFGSLRVTEEEEYDGLDISQHSENAYSLGGGGSIAEPMRASIASSAPMPLLAKPGHTA